MCRSTVASGRTTGKAEDRWFVRGVRLPEPVSFSVLQTFCRFFASGGRKPDPFHIG